MSVELPGNFPFDPEIIRKTELERVHDRCYDEVVAGLAAPGDADQIGAGAIHCQLARQAAEKGDVAAIEKHMHALLDLDNPATVDLAETCLLGIKAGSSEADVILSSKLAIENAKAALDGPYGEQPTAGILLKSVLSVCARRNIPAYRWINENTEQGSARRWYMFHFYGQRQLQLEKLPERREKIRIQLGAMMGALREANFPDDFVCKQIVEGIEDVDDRDLAQDLLNIFAHALPNLRADQVFDLSTQLGQLLVKQATPEMLPAIANCRQVAAFAAEGLIENDKDYHTKQEITKKLLTFDLARMTLRNVPAPQIAQFITERFSRLLAQHTADEAGHVDVASMVDQKLSQSINMFLKRGNLAGAAELLEYMTTSAAYEGALANCLQYAQTPTDVEIFRSPNAITHMVHPGAELMLRAMHIKVANDADPDAGAECALALAMQVNSEPGADGGSRYIYRLFRDAVVADPSRVLPLGWQILSTLRARQYPYDALVAQISRELIEAGDPDEPARALQHIRTSSPESRLQSIWDLANVLREVLKQSE